MDLPIGSRKISPFSLVHLNKLYRSGLFSDFTISVARDPESPPIELRVHRIVLAAASEYFATLFQVGTKETQESRLTLTGTNPVLFQRLIEAVYGQTHESLRFKDQIELLKMIKFYRFFVPMDRLHRYIVSMEIPQDGISDYISMIEYVYDGLTPETIDLIAKKICPESQLVDLSDEMLHLIFSSRHFPRNNFQDELQVFRFIHHLVLLDHTPDLYRYVKFTNLRQDQRNDLVARDQIAPEILDRYLEANARFPLTFNLKSHLLERFEANCEMPLEPITVLIGKEYHLVSKTAIGVNIRGDGDQTPIRALFSRSGPIAEGDIVEISEYTLISDRKGEVPFSLYASQWIRV